MFDTRIRAALAPGLDAVGGRLASAGVSPLALTVTGALAGVGACVSAAFALWPLAAVLWLVNRALDGLDGPVARRRGATDLGGFFDIVADFTVYAGFVVGVAIARPEARLACLALLTAYYISGTAFLALSSLQEKRARLQEDRGADGDGRSLRFVGGLAEGAETVVVYLLFCLLPGRAELIAWLFTAAVAVTAVQRVVTGARVLWAPAAPPPQTFPPQTFPSLPVPPRPLPPRRAADPSHPSPPA